MEGMRPVSAVFLSSDVVIFCFSSSIYGWLLSELLSLSLAPRITSNYSVILDLLLDPFWMHPHQLLSAVSQTEMLLDWLAEVVETAARSCWR
jgi:hypothetical protein